MEHAIFINRMTAERIAGRLNAQQPHSAVVRAAMSRSCLLGYHVSQNGLNVTENVLEAM